MRTPPCKGCCDRETGCHTKCERYAEWRRYMDDENAKKREKASANDIMYDAIHRTSRYYWNKRRK